MNDSQLLVVQVPAAKSRQRLDHYLTNCIPDISRSKIQRLIKEGYVTVNGGPVKAKHTVLPFERIEVRLPKPPPMQAVPEDIPLEIVYEDESLLVINKPAGMVVHPGSGNPRGTMVNALLGRGGDLSGGSGALRPGIVHRLDKDTSGLLVVAKDDNAHRKLAGQFENKTASRLYEALVWTRFTQLRGRVEAPISRSRRDRKMMAVNSDGKQAATAFEVIEKFAFTTLLRLKLGTGRTHQIRVHMKSMGTPVFGDQVYGGRGSGLAGLSADRRGQAKEMLLIMPRQALHARTLGFIHPVTAQEMQFSSELPADFLALLALIRSEEGRTGQSAV